MEIALESFLVVTVQNIHSDKRTQRQIGDHCEEGNNASNRLPLGHLREAHKPLWSVTACKTISRTVQSSTRAVRRRSVPDFHHRRLCWWCACGSGVGKNPKEVCTINASCEFLRRCMKDEQRNCTTPYVLELQYQIL